MPRRVVNRTSFDPGAAMSGGSVLALRTPREAASRAELPARVAIGSAPTGRARFVRGVGLSTVAHGKSGSAFA